MFNNYLKISFIFIAGAIVASCAIRPEQSLSEAELKTFAYQATDVSITSLNKVKWGRFKREQARINKGNPIDGTTVEAAKKKQLENADFAYSALFPSSDEHANKMLTLPMEKSMKTEMDKIMLGDRPVKGVVTIEEVAIASAAQKLLVGGGNYLLASVQLVDVSTNSVLASFPKARVVQGSLLNGVSGTLLAEVGKRTKFERASDSFAQHIRRWFVPPKKDDAV